MAITVAGVSFGYPGGETLFFDVSFRVDTGAQKHFGDIGNLVVGLALLDESVLGLALMGVAEKPVGAHYEPRNGETFYVGTWEIHRGEYRVNQPGGTSRVVVLWNSAGRRYTAAQEEQR